MFNKYLFSLRLFEMETKTNFYFKAYIFGPNPRAIIKSKQIILSNAKTINGCLKIKSSFKDFKVLILAKVQHTIEQPTQQAEQQTNLTLHAT